MLVLVVTGLLLPAARAQASSSRLRYTDTTNLTSQQAGPVPSSKLVAWLLISGYM